MRFCMSGKKTNETKEMVGTADADACTALVGHADQVTDKAARDSQTLVGRMAVI